VYNEYIYDLLSRAPSRGKRRSTCKLAEDTNKVRVHALRATLRCPDCDPDPRLTTAFGGPQDVFIRGLKEVQVNNIEEAFQVLTVGRRNQKVAATTANMESSRR